jgi:hypothetical protein
MCVTALVVPGWRTTDSGRATRDYFAVGPDKSSRAALCVSDPGYTVTLRRSRDAFFESRVLGLRRGDAL